MSRYTQQEVTCKHCGGAGRVLMDWEDYVYLHLPDRLNESLESLNRKLPIRLEWDDIARRAKMPPGTLQEILRASYHAKLFELYQLADALEVRLSDLLPIVDGEY